MIINLQLGGGFVAGGLVVGGPVVGGFGFLSTTIQCHLSQTHLMPSGKHN